MIPASYAHSRTRNKSGPVNAFRILSLGVGFLANINQITSCLPTERTVTVPLFVFSG